jgi:hypothetical protein
MRQKEQRPMAPPPLVMVPLKCDECPGVATVGLNGSEGKFCYDCARQMVEAAMRRSASRRRDRRVH